MRNSPSLAAAAALLLSACVTQGTAGRHSESQSAEAAQQARDDYRRWHNDFWRREHETAMRKHRDWIVDQSRRRCRDALDDTRRTTNPIRLFVDQRRFYCARGGTEPPVPSMSEVDFRHRLLGGLSHIAIGCSDDNLPADDPLQAEREGAQGKIGDTLRSIERVCHPSMEYIPKPPTGL